MRPFTLPLAVAALLAAAILAAGCNDGDPPTTPPVNQAAVVPDFTLEDVNPTSATAGQGVSPRDYLTKVSAWYFGHST